MEQAFTLRWHIEDPETKRIFILYGDKETVERSVKSAGLKGELKPSGHYLRSRNIIVDPQDGSTELTDWVWSNIRK